MCNHRNYPVIIGKWVLFSRDNAFMLLSQKDKPPVITHQFILLSQDNKPLFGDNEMIISWSQDNSMRTERTMAVSVFYSLNFLCLRMT